MKQRRTKILALLLSAAMAVGSPATAFTVSAEDWVSADEIVGFEDDWEASGDDWEVAEEEAVFSDGEEFEFSSDVEDAETDTLISGDMAPADMVAGKAYSITASTIMRDTGLASGMYAMDSVIVTLQSDGTYLVRMHQTSVNRNLLAITEDKNEATKHTVPWYVGTGEDGYWLTIPVKSLTEPLYFSMCNEERVSQGKEFGNIVTCTFDVSTLAESTENPAVSSDIKIQPAVTEEKADYTAVDAALAMIPEDLSVYTDESVAAVTAAKNAIVRDYGKDKQAEVDKMAADLKAAVEALVLKENPIGTTELTVTNTTGMFKVTKAVLQKYESGQKLLLTLSSKGYEYLFKGTYEDAVANGNNRDNWIKFKDTADGYQFEIPVTDGETKICLVSISKNKLANYDAGTAALEKAFYPRQVEIDYSAGTLVAGDFDHTVSLNVTNNVKMFSVSEAALHTVGGPNSNGYKETLELTMGSTSFDQIYVGSAEEAETAESTIAITDQKASVLMKENETGGTTILDYLEKPVVLSFHSVKKDTWYERMFTVSKKNGTVNIVEHVAATDVKLDAEEKELIEGQSFDLAAAVSPENTNDSLVWSSSDEKVATVVDGKVTAVGEGTAQITATAGKVSATCTITVVKKTFTYIVQAMLAKGTSNPTKDATDVVATVTDEDGNVIESKLNVSKMLEFADLDATKTYTLKVSREGYYPVSYEKNGSVYTYTAIGGWDYEKTITRADAGKTENVNFRLDNLKVALKDVPADLSLYTKESVDALQKVIESIDVNETDFAKRDELAETLKTALGNLKILEDGEYVTDVTVSTGLSVRDLYLTVKDGEMKATFIGNTKAYGKIFMGTSSAAKKAADTDPDMILPDNDGNTVFNSLGEEAYQFTIPVSAFSNAITFSSYATARKKWQEQTITFSVSNLKKYVEATDISLDKTESLLDAGKTLTLTAAVNPENASYKNVFWKSSDESIATVKNGVVTGVAEGTATITVSNGKISKECQIAVHTFEITKPAVAATCTETGLTEEIKCSTCEEILQAQEVIPALGHTEEVIPGTAATCTKTGLTDGSKCTVCGETVKAQEVIPALGHTEEIIPGTAATCTKNGWTEGKRCSVCKVILKSQKVIKATGHKEEVIPAVAATPGHTGLTEGKKCSVCGEILVAQTETPALPILVTNVKVSAKTSVKIAAGKKVQLQAVIAPTNAENKAVSWKSSNKKVATVNSKGVVTMKKNAGGKTVVITATAKDGSKVYGKIKLTCMKGSVTKVTISGKKTVKAGKSLTLKAKVEASGKANKKVAWSSSNKKLATVTSKGVVKTFKGKKGTVKITARSLDGTNKKATFKIKIK